MDCLLTQHRSALAQWSLSTRGKLGTGPLFRYLTFVLVDVTVEEPIEAIGDNDGTPVTAMTTPTATLTPEEGGGALVIVSAI